MADNSTPLAKNKIKAIRDMMTKMGVPKIAVKKTPKSDNATIKLNLLSKRLNEHIHKAISDDPKSNRNDGH